MCRAEDAATIGALAEKWKIPLWHAPAPSLSTASEALLLEKSEKFVEGAGDLTDDHLLEYVLFGASWRRGVCACACACSCAER